MFEEQSSENTGSVLSSDLIRYNHRLHHQVGDARQRVLLEVQQDGTLRWKDRRGSYKISHLVIGLLVFGLS